MNVRCVWNWYTVAALAGVGFGLSLSEGLLAQPAPAANVEEGAEVLTRGPVHEAFAETVTYNPKPGIVAPKSPPAAIEEVPPDQRPEGTNVAWIPGYWAWDDERNDFLWISGIWRDLPPGRQWVPGYWAKARQGFQWTSGYWTDAKATTVQYLPEPPATVEIGPSAPAPSADQTWLPGCWVWQQDRYAWRPGFWAVMQPDWVWIPAHYVWAPRGCIFVDGYWDHTIGRRGVLFAPVYFDSGVYVRSGFSYAPTLAIDLGVFASSLFLRPRYQHYYFGDYYAANYQAAGFLPRFSFQANHFGYDPIYDHQRWQHRQDRGWEQRQQADFQNRRDHENLRPPHTWAAQKALVGSGVQAGMRVAMPLDDFRKSRNTSLRLQPVTPTERTQFNQRAQEVHRFGEERQKLEANSARVPIGTRNKAFEPAKVQLPGSPIVGRPGDALGKDNAPPKTYDAPRVDKKIEAKPRGDRSQQPREQRQLQPQPKAERQAPQQQPKTERQAPLPQPKTERQAPQQQPKTERQAPQQQPKAERQAPPPQPKTERQAPQQQPKAERQAPPPQPKTERQAPQQQPKAERQAPPPAQSKQDNTKDKDKK